MNYLFRYPNAGFYDTYTPFTCKKKLSQEQAIEFMEKHGSSVYRTGADLNMLVSVANDHGYEIKPFYCTYKKRINPEDYKYLLFPEMIKSYIQLIEDLKLDWLPNDFSNWDIIDGIGGNY